MDYMTIKEASEKSLSWVCAWDISPSAKPLEEQFPMQKS